MNDVQLAEWFEGNKVLLETAYIDGQQPWQQSGFGLHSNHPQERWEAVRRPVADCIDHEGTFLDIGCANGYLLECVMRWAGERGIDVTPYGLDLSEKLVALARERLPLYADHIFIGNAWDWVPPQKFDYVRTELVYVPDQLHGSFVSRLLNQYLNPGGKLLVAEYRSRNNTAPTLDIDRHLVRLGFHVTSTRSGLWDGMEYTRIAVISPFAT